MAVPSFQTWFLPLLKHIADGKDHAMADLYDELADEMGLSAEDRSVQLKSGTQFVYHNRIAWAKTYLKKAGLLESPGRGIVRITQRGKGVLAENPPALTVKFLRRFPEFVDFHTYKPQPATEDNGTDAGAETDTAESPQDAMERAEAEIRRQLAIELLDRVMKSPPSFFERLVVDLLLRMGYGGSREDAGKIVGRTGDGGVDGVINEDRLGLDLIYVQAKRWEGTVGRPVVQGFAGSLEGVRARKGILITTSTFSSDAQSYVRQIEKKIVLIDGQTLANLMIEHNVGVALESTYEVKRLDLDYFGE